MSPNASYATLRQQAEEKWKTFHSNLYGGSQAYHLLLEDGQNGLMGDPNIPLQQLDSEKHLTTSDRELLNAIKEDIMAHTDTIIEHGYTGTVHASHTEETLSSVAISLVTKRLVYLKEFLNGLDSYGLKDINQTHPEACKPLYVKNVGKNDAVDANYLFSSLHPEHANGSSSRFPLSPR